MNADSQGSKKDNDRPDVWISKTFYVVFQNFPAINFKIRLTSEFQGLFFLRQLSTQSKAIQKTKLKAMC